MSDLDLTDDPFVQLTDRERVVAVALAVGLDPGEISDQLNIAVATVYTHRLNLLRKTKSRNNVELARKAIKFGLVAQP